MRSFGQCYGRWGAAGWRKTAGTLLFALSVGLWPAFARAGVGEVGSVEVAIVQPAVGAVVGDGTSVIAKVSSTFEIKEVIAEVEGQAVALTFSPEAYIDRFGTHPGWKGALPLAGLPRGPLVLTVTAADFLGNSGRDERTLTHDQKPLLKVLEPLPGTVARPEVQILATCEDDDANGCSLEVSLGGVIILSGRNRVQGSLPLAGAEGESVTLRFQATDSLRQVTAAEIPVYVESSARLKEVVTVPGEIWNVAPDRILFLEMRSDRGVLKIRDRVSGEEKVVLDRPGDFPRYGVLTPQGAIFVTQSGDVLSALIFENRGGTLEKLGFPNSNASLIVKGPYAIWNTGSTLFVRDLVAGTNRVVTAAAGNWRNDVAANGDVVYWSTRYNIYRDHGGTENALTSDAVLWNVYPLTDGENVVYRKQDPCCGQQQYGLFLHDGSQELELAPLTPRPDPVPGVDYQVNNGWVAFTRLGTGGQLQVWTRSPAGKETQLTFYGDSSRISALAPTGEVMFQHYRLYLIRPADPPIEIGSRLATPFWQEGKWWATLGRTLFEVVPGGTDVRFSGLNVTGRTFRFRITAAEKQSVTVEASEDLKTWNPLTSSVLSGGSAEFVDESLGASVRRFYRARTP